MDWKDLIAGALIYLGLLLFLISLHIIKINTTGTTRSVLNTTFIVFVGIYGISVILSFVGMLTQVLRWVTWITTTPNWIRKRGKGP